MGTKLLLTHDELLELLRVARATLWRIRQEDPSFPPAIRITKRRISFRLADVEAWISSREVRR